MIMLRLGSSLLLLFLPQLNKHQALLLQASSNLSRIIGALSIIRWHIDAMDDWASMSMSSGRMGHCIIGVGSDTPGILDLGIIGMDWDHAAGIISCCADNSRRCN